MTHIDVTQVTENFRCALEQILARAFSSAPDSSLSSIAVAYSGGLDSTVLLHLAHDYAAQRGIRLFAFHVHHGLSAHADQWLVHCQSECARLGIEFNARRVSVAKNDRSGLEAAARAARYATLGEMCRLHGAPLLLTAHHRDDQIETVLLQMLRGSGMAGLSGMDQVNAAPDLMGDATMLIARPLLEIVRSSLHAYAAENGISHIEDESNADVRHPRNALRNQILPLLAQYFPAFRECIARSAQHAQSAQHVLHELAQQDLAACLSGSGLDAEHLRELGDERSNNLLRYWLAENGMRMPSTAWLREAHAQLLGVRADAQVCVTLDGVDIRRYRDKIVLMPQPAKNNIAPLVFCWNGEQHLPFPTLGGVLHFELAEQGVDAGWLRGQTLRIEFRRRTGTLKLAPNRPARSLKAHYQERGIPAWERLRLPLVYAGDQLLFAAGIGQDCRCQAGATGTFVQLLWEPDAT